MHSAKCLWKVTFPAEREGGIGGGGYSARFSHLESTFLALLLCSIYAKPFQWNLVIDEEALSIKSQWTKGKIGKAMNMREISEEWK